MRKPKRTQCRSSHFPKNLRHIADYPSRGGVVGLDMALDWGVNLVLVVERHFVSQGRIVISKLVCTEP